MNNNISEKLKWTKNPWCLQKKTLNFCVFNSDIVKLLCCRSYFYIGSYIEIVWEWMHVLRGFYLIGPMGPISAILGQKIFCIWIFISYRYDFRNIFWGNCVLKMKFKYGFGKNSSPMWTQQYFIIVPLHIYLHYIPVLGQNLF